MGDHNLKDKNSTVEYTLRTEYRKGENLYLLYHMGRLIIQTTHKDTVMSIVKEGKLYAI